MQGATSAGWREMSLRDAALWLLLLLAARAARARMMRTRRRASSSSSPPPRGDLTGLPASSSARARAALAGRRVIDCYGATESPAQWFALRDAGRGEGGQGGKGGKGGRGRPRARGKGKGKGRGKRELKQRQLKRAERAAAGLRQAHAASGRPLSERYGTR